MSEMVGLRRGIAVIEALGESSAGLTFSEIEQCLGDASPSTITRLLKVMQDEGLVTKGADGYGLGQRSHQLAASISSPKTKAEAIHLAVDKLGQTTQHSAAYMTLGEAGITMCAKSEQPEGIHYLAIGKANTNHDKHGFYRAALAHATPEERARLNVPADDAWHDIQQASVWTSSQDDRPGLTRVVSPILINGTLDGIIGVSYFYCDQPSTTASAVDTIATALTHTLSSQLD